jgi:hypothetical protein
MEHMETKEIHNYGIDVKKWKDKKNQYNEQNLEYKPWVLKYMNQILIH